MSAAARWAREQLAKATHADGGPKYRQGKKRRMVKFRIDEISAVDRPAQEGAVAVLMKRADLEKCGEEHQSPYVLLTSAVDGHQHAVWIRPGERGGETSYSRGPDEEQGHSHPWTVDAAGTLTVGETDGHTHTVDAAQLVEAIMAAALGKRQFSAEERERLAASGAAMEDGSFPIATTADLRNAISAFGRAKNKAAAARHIARRARALGASAMLPEEGELAELITKAAQPASQEDPIVDEIAKLKTEIEQLTKRAARAEAVLALPAEQRSHFDKLDAADQDAFLAKTAEQRKADVDAELAKAKDQGEVVFTASDGTAYTKSDDPRLVKLARQADEDRKQLSLAKAANDQAALEKRAAEELSNLPGTVQERAALLKAVDAIADEAAREAARKALKAGNDAIKGAFTLVGHRNGQADASAEAELDRLAKAHATAHNVDFYTAYDAVAEANPELVKRAIGSTAPAAAN